MVAALLEMPVRLLRRMSSELDERRRRRFVDAQREHDPTARELIEGHLEDWREDVYTASGDGVGGPGLPETTPSGLYEEFERDEARPRNPAD